MTSSCGTVNWLTQRATVMTNRSATGAPEQKNWRRPATIRTNWTWYVKRLSWAWVPFTMRLVESKLSNASDPTAHSTINPIMFKFHILTSARKIKSKLNSWQILFTFLYFRETIDDAGNHFFSNSRNHQIYLEIPLDKHTSGLCSSFWIGIELVHV